MPTSICKACGRLMKDKEDFPREFLQIVRGIAARGIAQEMVVPIRMKELADLARVFGLSPARRDTGLTELVLAVDHDRVVRFRPDAPELSRIALIDDQPLTKSIEDETVVVIVAMVPIALTSLEGKEDSVRVIPTRPEHSPVNSAEEP